MPFCTHKFAASPQETFTVSEEVSGFVLPCLPMSDSPEAKLRPSYVPTAELVAGSKAQIEFIGTGTSCVSSHSTKIGIFFRKCFLLYLVLVDLNVLSDVLHPLLLRLSHSPAEFTASPRFAIIHSFHHSCFYDPK